MQVKRERGRRIEGAAKGKQTEEKTERVMGDTERERLTL